MNQGKNWLKLGGAALGLACAAAFGTVAAQEAPKSIRIGWALAKSGPNTPGTEATVRPNYEMWVKDVNAAGGLMLKAYGKRVPIEVVEYDDRSSNEEAVRAVERLITQDKVDIVLPPWGTAANMAVAPTLARHGYPHIGTTVTVDRAADFVKRWPNLFFMLGTTGMYSEALFDLLAEARKEGRIGDRIAMVHVADGFGVENSMAARKAAQAHGFKLVLDKSYPVGSQDLSQLLNEVNGLSPDVFIAFSYPPDTVLITDQARVAGLQPKVFFTGVGTQFPFFQAKYGAQAEGQMGLGGIDGSSPVMKAYVQRHQAATGKPPENWASPVTYASLQVLQQAIEQVGKIDRAAIIDQIRNNRFETLLGPIKFDNQVLNRGLFLIGQWQGNVFQGVAPANHPAVKPALIPHPASKP